MFSPLSLGVVIATRDSEEVAGHLRGLFVLFYAEMWERFSYYGVRTLPELIVSPAVKRWMHLDTLKD